MKKVTPTLIFLLARIMSTILLSTYCLADNITSSSLKIKNEIDVLMISSDIYGSSLVIGDTVVPSIKQ